MVAVDATVPPAGHKAECFVLPVKKKRPSARHGQSVKTRDSITLVHFSDLSDFFGRSIFQH